MNRNWHPYPAGLLLIVLALFTLSAATDEQNQAGLVIDYGGGQVDTVCVSFSTDEINGYDLLQQSGLAFEIDAQGLGAAICNIEDTGCPAGNCFCQCRGDDCQYWSYWHQIDGVWEYSAAGAGTYRVKPGAVDGWTWGPGSVTEAIAPASISFAEICPAPVPQPAGNNVTDSTEQAPEASTERIWLPFAALGLLLGSLVVGGLVLRRTGGNKA